MNLTSLVRWFLSRAIRHSVGMCRQADRIARAQRDLLPPASYTAVRSASAAVRSAIAGGLALPEVKSLTENLERVANQHLRPYPNPGWRENVEVLLVTGAIVLALRTFFFQPMAIPSGSAQPTLWGITVESLKDKPGQTVPWGPLGFFNWLWTGQHHYRLTAAVDSVITRIEEPSNLLPFVKRQRIWINNQPHSLWFTPDEVARKAGLREGQRFRRGEAILHVRVTTGDHLFVNRMTYNFRRPHRGEIIVFQSDSLPSLIQNTHYIKRLIAVGNDRVRIGDDRHIILNGERLDASTPFFENVYSFDPKLPPRQDHYSGHVNEFVARKFAPGMPEGFAAHFRTEQDEFVVPPDHYLAFGDNTMNSHDGRSWGSFPRDLLVGKAGFVWWPITSRFGWGYR